MLAMANLCFMRAHGNRRSFVGGLRNVSGAGVCVNLYDVKFQPTNRSIDHAYT
jgi:hypothetical protein